MTYGTVFSFSVVSITDASAIILEFASDPNFLFSCKWMQLKSWAWQSLLRMGRSKFKVCVHLCHTLAWCLIYINMNRHREYLHESAHLTRAIALSRHRITTVCKLWAIHSTIPAAASGRAREVAWTGQCMRRISLERASLQVLMACSTFTQKSRFLMWQVWLSLLGCIYMPINLVFLWRYSQFLALI